jgi:hypothetical protein
MVQGVLEKFIEKWIAFYGTQRFITDFTKPRYWTQS